MLLFINIQAIAKDVMTNGTECVTPVWTVYMEHFLVGINGQGKKHPSLYAHTAKRCYIKVL